MPLLNGNATLGLLNSAAFGGGVPVARAIPYAAGNRRSLDVYAPKSAARAPVAIFFYGGGWDSGAKEDYRFVGGSLVRRGYVAVVPDYRLYPEARYSDFLQDAAAAVRWAKDHAATYGGDADRLILIGHSAGAYIAAMLSLDARWLGEVGLQPRRDIAAAVGLAGPYDFLPLHTDRLRAIFAPSESLPQTQPINHVTGKAPPMLLAVARKDVTVRPGNTHRLAARLRDAGSTVKVITYSKLTHKTIVGVLARPLRFLAPVLDDITQFVDAHAGPRLPR